MLRGTLAIALVALTASACSVSRSASVKAEVRGLTAEVRDSLRVEQLMVAVHDTIVETTTITIRENEQGDTVRMRCWFVKIRCWLSIPQMPIPKCSATW